MSDAPIWKRLGYRTQWQYRKAKAQSRINPETGKPFTGARQERDQRARARGQQRDYAAERARRDQLAQSRGFPSSNRETALKRAAQKAGITFDTLNDMRRQNRKHWSQVQGGGLPKEFPLHIHRYREPKNASAARFVKYVQAYYHAIVDPNHNWESQLGEDGRWKMSEKRTSAGMAVTPDFDKWWYVYLVEAMEAPEAYSEAYFEARYGYESEGE